jgi:hypothetical protein
MLLSFACTKESNQRKVQPIRCGHFLKFKLPFANWHMDDTSLVKKFDEPAILFSECPLALVFAALGT